MEASFAIERIEQEDCVHREKGLVSFFFFSVRGIYRMDNRSTLRFLDRSQNASFVIFILDGLNHRKNLMKLKRKLECSPVFETLQLLLKSNSKPLYFQMRLQ